MYNIVVHLRLVVALSLELVVICVKSRNVGLETLANTDLGYQLLHLATLLERGYKKVVKPYSETGYEGCLQPFMVSQ